MRPRYSRFPPLKNLAPHPVEPARLFPRLPAANRYSPGHNHGHRHPYNAGLAAAPGDPSGTGSHAMPSLPQGPEPSEMRSDRYLLDSDPMWRDPCLQAPADMFALRQVTLQRREYRQMKAAQAAPPTKQSRPQGRNNQTRLMQTGFSLSLC